MGIIAAGHRHGWAVAEGGSQSITNAMVALLDRPRRQDEDPVYGSETALAAPAGGCDDVRSGAERGGPASSETVSPVVFRVPSPGSAAAPVRSRSTSPSTVVCPGPTRRPVGQALCTFR